LEVYQVSYTARPQEWWSLLGPSREGFMFLWDRRRGSQGFNTFPAPPSEPTQGPKGFLEGMSPSSRSRCEAPRERLNREMGPIHIQGTGGSNLNRFMTLFLLVTPGEERSNRSLRASRFRYARSASLPRAFLGI
jgi:hypothetical protein